MSIIPLVVAVIYSRPVGTTAIFFSYLYTKSLLFSTPQTHVQITNGDLGRSDSVCFLKCRKVSAELQLRLQVPAAPHPRDTVILTQKVKFFDGFHLG